MTEDDAKTKACCGAPAVLVGLLMQRPGTEVLAPERVGKCLGSDCMAWRTSSVPMDQDHAWDDAGRPKQIVNGFCGLAGDQQ